MMNDDRYTEDFVRSSLNQGSTVVNQLFTTLKFFTDVLKRKKTHTILTQLSQPDDDLIKKKRIFSLFTLTIKVVIPCI